MRPPHEDIPLLTDVVVPGERAPQDLSTGRAQPDSHRPDVDENTYHTIFGDEDPVEEIDVGVEVIVDSVLEKHILKMRAELIAEFTALLEPASRDRR